MWVSSFENGWWFVHPFDGRKFVFVSVYVDNLIIVETSQNIEWVIQELQGKFKITDLGPVKDLLHTEISYVPGKFIWLSQISYIDKALKRFSMDECRPESTPQDPGNLPEPVEDNHLGIDEPKLLYRELVGSL